MKIEKLYDSYYLHKIELIYISIEHLNKNSFMITRLFI